MTVSFSYTKKYSISTTTEYAVGIDTFSGVEYSIPDNLLNLEVDNLKINQALYDAFATTGNTGQVLLTDSEKVYWGDVAGVGTPLQTIGIYNEGVYQGVVANLNFLDGTDPNDLIKVQLGINTAFADIYVSDKWSSVNSGIYTNIYRLSNVGIGTTNPTEKLTVLGSVGIGGSLIFNDNAGISTVIVAIGTERFIQNIIVDCGEY